MAVTRAGLVTPRQLRSHRRYAVLACGLVAAVLPGDAVTRLLETLPLYVLFEVICVHRRRRRTPKRRPRGRRVTRAGSRRSSVVDIDLANPPRAPEGGGRGSEGP